MLQLEELNQFQNFLHAFSDKHEGNMSFRWGGREVLENRKKFLTGLGVELRDCTGTSLEHGVNVVKVNSEDRGRGMEDPESALAGDAFLTDSPRVLLFLLTGDCLPIILYDPVHSVAGVVHASRHNIPKKLMKETMERMREWYGVLAKDVIVGIGPGAGKESYVFPSAYREELLPVWQDFLIEVNSEKFALDLAGRVEKDLRKEGVSAENIHLALEDTIKNPDFFSHYRSRLTGETEGRMATVVGIIDH